MSTDQNSAYGAGIATQNLAGETLGCSFHTLGIGNANQSHTNQAKSSIIGEDPIRGVRQIPVDIKINLEQIS